LGFHLCVLHDALPQLGHFLCHGGHRLLGLAHLSRGSPLAVQKPEA